jgi:CRISPR-associated RAMP protein (TIGR02581 family)
MGRPVIPGSSFKGAFRAGVERLLPNVPNFRTCALNPGDKCLSMDKNLSEAYRAVGEAASRGNQFGNSERDHLQALGRANWMGQEADETHLLDLLNEYLCDTCKTFGSVHLASVVRFQDLPLKHKDWGILTQIRDGVGIDRDSERAVAQIKFDFEIVPAQTAFDFNLTVENPTARDLGLVALGLQEFANGMIPLGGIRSRGLGQCRLENVQMAMVDFTQPTALKDYLVTGWPAPKPLDIFIEKSMAALIPA